MFDRSKSVSFIATTVAAFPNLTFKFSVNAAAFPVLYLKNNR